MANGEKEKTKGPLRLALNDRKSTRRTLARLCRMRFNQQIDSLTFRDMVYAVNTLASYDKMDVPIQSHNVQLVKIENKTYEDREKRIEELLPGYREYQKAREAERAKRAGQEQDEMVKRAFENYRGHEPAAIETETRQAEPESIEPLELAVIPAAGYKCGIGAKR